MIKQLTNSPSLSLLSFFFQANATGNSIAEETIVSTSNEKVAADYTTECLQSLETLKVRDSLKDNFEDIFQDMEPVISKPQIIHIKRDSETSNKFALIPEVSESGDGWGEDFDWNCVEADVSENNTSAVS